MRRVLMVSPHFPPDTGAATHRVRLLAPHLTKYGWEPTVLTLEPTSYEGRLDPELMELVPTVLRVVRCRAWNPRWTRRLGFGDLGLRAFWGLYRTCVQLLNQENFDVLFITILPGYPALLGPIMHRKVGIPYVLDYQDPWVSAWGLAVGSGPNGEADLKSRASRWIATQLEPIALRHAAAITAVSAGTYEQIVARMPEIVDVPRAAIPVGGEEQSLAVAGEVDRHRGDRLRGPLALGRQDPSACAGGEVHQPDMGFVDRFEFDQSHSLVVEGKRKIEPACSRQSCHVARFRRLQRIEQRQVRR